MGFFPKGNIPDGDYLLGRAETECMIAQSAGSEPAAEAHHALASAYLGRIFSDESPDDWSYGRLQIRRENRHALCSVFSRLPAEPAVRDESEDEFEALLRKLS